MTCVRVTGLALLLAGGALAAPVAAADADVAASSAQVERGRQVFEHRCSMCHRAGGTGTILLERRLGKEKSLLERRDDLRPEYVRHVVRWGLVNMPRISRVEVPDADLDALVVYLSAPRQ